MATINAPAFPTASISWYAGMRRRQLVWIAFLTILASAAFAGLALLAQLLSVVVLVALVVVTIIVWQPRTALYLVFGIILTFEAGGADPLMAPAGYFHGGLAGAPASPLELLLVLTLVTWFAQGLARRRLEFRGGRLWWPIVLFSVALVFGLVRGAIAGGNANIALWECRFLFYIVLCYVLAANLIRTMHHLRILSAIALVAMSLYAIEGAYRRIALIDTGRLGVHKDFAYSHEVVIYLGALLLLVLAQNVFGAPRWQRWVGLAIAPVAGYTLLATERRAGYIAVIIAFLAYTLVFLVVHRRAFFGLAIPVLVLGSIYLPVFWNNSSLIGQPARAVRSLTQPDPRDAASNEYREKEKVNVRATIESAPLLGIGFGREFLFVVPLPDLSWWPFWRYEPHANILWVWMKTGGIGFVVFWVLMGSALARAAHLVKTLHEPEKRTFALLALAGITSTLVFCYVDLGLTSGRVTVFLGIVLGTLAVLDRLPDERPQLKGSDT